MRDQEEQGRASEGGHEQTQAQKPGDQPANLTRRKLLASMGIGAVGLVGSAAGVYGASIGKVRNYSATDGEEGSVSDAVYGGTGCSNVIAIPDIASLFGLIGTANKSQLLILGYHPSTSVGGGHFFWNMEIQRDQHDGGRYFSPTVPWTTNVFAYLSGVGETSGTSYGVWERLEFAACSLYDWGGLFEGDCGDAMNAALASDLETITVPDRVTLGQHTFDCGKKIIKGGFGVRLTGVGAGLRPRNCEYIEIRDFTDLAMSMNIADRHIFVAPAPGAEIGTFAVRNCSGSGGIIGVAASFENGRKIGRCEITHNAFSDLNGEVGGQGYGIQYANQNSTGTALIAHNKVTRAGRHSFYIARNPGGLVELIGNTAIDHRENSTVTRNNYRPAFCIARSSNVVGYGNSVDGYYDGAWLIDWENEPVPNPLYSNGVAIYGSSIRNPKNFLNSISFGYVSPNIEALRGIKFIGIDYECDGVQAPLFAFNYGHDLLISHISARFKNVTGVIRLGLLTGNSEANSSNHVVENVNVHVTNSAGATFSVFRIQLGSNTEQISTSIRYVEYDSVASVNKTFDAQKPVTNALIELIGVEEDGLAGGTPKRTKFPSLPWNGKVDSTAISTPVGNLLPRYFGQECYLTNTGVFWKANGITNADWVQIS